MELYLTFISFVLGLVIASFLNALLYRIDNGYKVPHLYTKGSHCEKCGKQLTWYELIPLLSYIIFRGKCTQCDYSIPKYYPVSELMLGIAFASIYYFSLPLLFFFVIIFLFVMSYFDRIYKGIPKDIVHVFLIFGFVSLSIRAFIENSIPDNAILLALGISIFLFLIGRILKKPFGLGDILVILGLGFLLSTLSLITFLYIFLLLSLLYSIYLLVTKKANMKSSLPLLPLMYISFSLFLLFYVYLSPILINWFFL
jgi:prepilin signal peptidase PulO-like enzyme (type II secretory pathway)